MEQGFRLIAHIDWKILDLMSAVPVPFTSKKPRSASCRSITDIIQFIMEVISLHITFTRPMLH